jgi:type IV fimbrial biogenesis protein FimT
MLARRTYQRGFNLIEVLVTITVLGVLLGTALPSMADWIRATQMRSNAENLQVGLRQARSEALKRNQVVTFWLVSSPATPTPPDDHCAPSADSGSWVVSMEDPTDKCHIKPSTTVSPRIVQTHGAGQSGSGATVKGLDASGNPATSVSFNGYGRPLVSPTRLARIDISHTDAGARQLSVEISLGGSLRMCDRGVEPGDLRACVQP